MQSNDDFNNIDYQSWHAVAPKEDCPHEEELDNIQIHELITKEILKAPCVACDNSNENWLCLICYNVFCSRYVKGHMAHHNKETGHNIALSFTDGSFWCYGCDSYIYSKELRKIAMKFSNVKFSGSEDSNSNTHNIENIVKSLTRKDDDREKVVFTREQLVKGLRDKEFKRVIFLTGAGISVSAGVPDFRSGTGLYAKLGEFDLPRPEAVFDIEYFKEKPETFYKVAKMILSKELKPTIAHKFIKMVADEGQLLLNFTQNIDGLETKAGVSASLLVEAHGHTRAAHCVLCKKEHGVEELMKYIEEGNVFRCECSGPVKPDIIFFHEQLPGDFVSKFEKIEEGDLVIVMGTSLKVYPFAALVDVVPSKVPVVMINRENLKVRRENFLFLEGDIDEEVGKLVEEVGWSEKLKALNGN